MRNHVLILIMYTNNRILLKIATIVLSITDFMNFIVYVYQIKNLKMGNYHINIEIEIKILQLKIKVLLRIKYK